MKFPAFSKLAAAAILIFTLAAPLYAQDTMAQRAPAAQKSELHYLKAGKPNASEILAPPPLLDSPEQAGDIAEVRSVFSAATPAEKDAAFAERTFSVFNFSGSVGAFFTETNLPITTKFFKHVQSDAAIVTDTGKDFFKRPRPYMTDTNLINGKLETSYSYPSGHSTETMTLALVLADLLPEHKTEIIAHARTMGWHRVQIARHYPTDIFAGRVLAQAIVKQFMKDEKFQKDFAAAKKELTAAEAAAKN